MRRINVYNFVDNSHYISTLRMHDIYAISATAATIKLIRSDTATNAQWLQKFLIMEMRNGCMFLS